MADTVEEIVTSFSAICPLWNGDVWDALQGKRFDAAEQYLQDILFAMPAERWSDIYWMGIAQGIPSFRGDLDLDVWKNKALPLIGNAILKSASPSKMSAAYSSIDLDSIKEFHSFIIASIPGKDEKAKIGWLKEETQPLLVTFLLASPLGLNLSGVPISQENITRLKTLPENIHGLLFSIQTPEIIKTIAEQNSIPEEKLGSIAALIGLVFLGFIHAEELSDKISKQANLSIPVGKSLFDSFNTRLFRPIQSDLDKIYAPLPHEETPSSPSTTPAPKTISLSDIGWAKQPAAISAINANVPKPAAVTPAVNASKTPVPTPTSAPVVPPPPPAPMILHEDTSFKPAEKNLNFSLAKPGNLDEMKTASGVPVPQAPAKAAVLEFGTVPVPAPKPVVPKPPLSSVPMPTASTGARNVSQITSAIGAPVAASAAPAVPVAPAMPKPISAPVLMPKPPVPTPTQAMNAIPVPRPPQAPQAPTIPTTPAQQPNKTVVKDFL